MRASIVIGGVVGLTLAAWAGTASAQEIEVDYYTPEYYQEYPVYFDDAGQPIYYVGGTVHLVPPSYVGYRNLLRHYRIHRHNYFRWYNERGRRYHGYRRVVHHDGYAPLYHDGYLVFYTDAGIPYYYQGNQMVYIPAHHPRYTTYRSHYAGNRVRYRTWYGRQGRHQHGYRHVAPAPVHPRPYRPAPVVHQPAPHYGQPVPAQPVYGGSHTVDCRVNPGHPLCRRGRPHAAPAPAPYVVPRGRGRRHR